MTIENDFLPFAVGGGANVIDQAAYAADSSLLSNGFQSGIAQSNQLNKVWRQSSIMAAVLADFIVAQTGQTAIDDGTTSTLVSNLISAVTATPTASCPWSGLTGAVPTFNQNTTGNAATATTATSVPYSGLTGTVPTWNQNTTGNAATATTAGTVSTVVASGATGTTQAANNNSTHIATTAYVDSAVAASTGLNPSGTYHSVASSQNGATRTNSTGHLMQVTICAGDGSGQTLVGSIVVAGVTIASGLNGSLSGRGDLASFLVANGAAYSFTFNALANLIAWHEFY